MNETAENPDAEADKIIVDCASLESPRSFFLFAGAGSGKTGSLVNVLSQIRKNQRDALMSRGQRVAVITYTRAASEVISQRQEFDPLVHVSTIHSFAWDLIGTYHADIRRWLYTKLNDDIRKLTELLGRTRAGTKTRIERESSLAEKRERLSRLGQIRTFVYSPTGENSGRSSLNHSEVIEICADFLRKGALQSILIGRFPFLFIDESQDTNKALIESFLAVEAAHQSKFCLGLFGDTMQRIFTEGKDRLREAIPPRWATPVKRMNWRCPGRVVRLINEIRKPVDKLEQAADPRKPEGFARCFILAPTAGDKESLENGIASRMADITGDENWRQIGRRKTLTLEHHMAARRLGFGEFFLPLYGVKDFRTGLLDGTLSGIPLFLDAILPLVSAIQRGNKFEIAKVIRQRSPLLKRKVLAEVQDKKSQLYKAQTAVAELTAMLQRPDLKTFDVLRVVAANELFEIPENLQATLRAEKVGLAAAESDPEVTTPGAVAGWFEALQAPFSQVQLVADYVSETSSFDTHQGVKGREFPRVMVVIDDDEARGFTFNFDKLFEVVPKTKDDAEKEARGDETSMDKTRRLFYVTCSRAENSLAVVCYSAQPVLARKFFIDNAWFSASEIEVLN